VVTHEYHDPCGNSDTRTFTFNMTVGLEELNAGAAYQVRSRSPSLVEVQDARSGGTLTLYDMQGRVVVQKRIGGSRTRVACPSGPLLWRISDPTGAIRTGKVVVL
jgi:hypothetical protein